MGTKLTETIQSMGEEAFIRRMEGLSSAERREIFQQLHVPPAGPSASVRRRNLRRIQAAWVRLAESGDQEAAEAFTRHWLAREAMPMIVEFLDAMGVDHHDGFLEEEDALRKLSPAATSTALRGLTARYDADDVQLYAALMDLSR